jgi:hypothetical protein
MNPIPMNQPPESLAASSRHSKRSVIIDFLPGFFRSDGRRHSQHFGLEGGIHGGDTRSRHGITPQ